MNLQQSHDDAVAAAQIDHDQRLISIEGIVHEVRTHSTNAMRYTLFPTDMSDMSDKWHTYTPIEYAKFDYLLPEGFNSVARQVETLNKEVDRLNDEYKRKIDKIKQRLQTLLAIENKLEDVPF